MESFVGTWRLLSLETRTADGDFTYPLGRDAIGYLIYTADGYMSASLMSDGRRNYADGDLRGGTVDEKLAAAESCISYCGRYEVGENRVIQKDCHRIAGRSRATLKSGNSSVNPPLMLKPSTKRPCGGH